MEKEGWIKNLKVGDKVLAVERWLETVNKFEAVVSEIADGYIVTKHRRPLRGEWSHYIHVYNEITTKNYFSPDGEINIEQL